MLQLRLRNNIHHALPMLRNFAILHSVDIDDIIPNISLPSARVMMYSYIWVINEYSFDVRLNMRFIRPWPVLRGPRSHGLCHINDGLLSVANKGAVLLVILVNKVSGLGEVVILECDEVQFDDAFNRSDLGGRMLGLVFEVVIDLVDLGS